MWSNSLSDPALALRLLGYDVVDQGIRHWAVRNLANLAPDVLLLYLQQLVEWSGVELLSCVIFLNTKFENLDAYCSFIEIVILYYLPLVVQGGSRHNFAQVSTRIDSFTSCFYP
ncbi:unnamed protein product [Protopolystoma xenopodis]|uniref:Uncharacterized protein n=1 Tax=Protopolystoma xenopodis TaxID=117903 RepID=A0A3S4ZRF4_9PLAT|nr:unnamed protein product [Protopolystoma xenopodis]